MTEYILGLDLGQAQDYSALGILQQVRVEKEPAVFHLRHLERMRLGTSYPAVIERVKVLMGTEELARKARLVVDATGVGGAVVDLLKEAQLSPVAITITGGDEVKTVPGGYHVPKRDVVMSLLVLYQTGRLKMADTLDEGPTLLQELLAFQKRYTAAANDVYGGRGAHDDLVLAVALAAWWGKEHGRGLRAAVITGPMQESRWRGPGAPDVFPGGSRWRR